MVVPMFLLSQEAADIVLLPLLMPPKLEQKSFFNSSQTSQGGGISLNPLGGGVVGGLLSLHKPFLWHQFFKPWFPAPALIPSTTAPWCVCRFHKRKVKVLVSAARKRGGNCLAREEPSLEGCNITDISCADASDAFLVRSHPPVKSRVLINPCTVWRLQLALLLLCPMLPS